MTATAREDPDLLAACSNGDEQALGALYDRYGKVAYGVALRVLRDSALAEDAVQDAFVSVWRQAATYDRTRGKASTWILTLVHRRAVDLVRRSCARIWRRSPRAPRHTARLQQRRFRDPVRPRACILTGTRRASPLSVPGNSTDCSASSALWSVLTHRDGLSVSRAAVVRRSERTCFTVRERRRTRRLPSAKRSERSEQSNTDLSGARSASLAASHL
jgi:RNA polymerase sigma factor (sigma-70 family)